MKLLKKADSKLSKKLPKKIAEKLVEKIKTNKLKKGSSKRRSFFIGSGSPNVQSGYQKDPAFESRKLDHLNLSLQPATQTSQDRFLDRIRLRSTAFPELNFEDVNLKTEFNGLALGAPFFISSMTSGTMLGEPINEALAMLSQEKQILMGVGSQRKELHSDSAMKEWQRIGKKYPKARFLSNLGLSQVIETPIDRIRAVVENLNAVGLIIHCNALQECIQKEGTPQFKNGLAAIEKLAHALKIPVIVKEVGFGFSQHDLVRLNQVGVTAVDFSGRGGTNWALIEALRHPKKSIRLETGYVFSDWGYDIKEWVDFRDSEAVSYQFWSSGGIRNGLDIAKMIAIGSRMVGMAQPWIKNLVVDLKNKKLDIVKLFDFYDKTYRELQIALFCCGYDNVESFRKDKVYYVR